MNKNFEIIFVSADNEEYQFNDCFSGMPWLAIPFSHIDTRNDILHRFKLNTPSLWLLPQLVILDEDGRVITKSIKDVLRYGAEGYPFSPERIKDLRDQEEEVRRNPSLESLLALEQHDCFLRGDKYAIRLPFLKGQTIGLYFASFRESHEFTTKLKTVYRHLQKRDEKFEVVWISADEDRDSFDEGLMQFPWMAIPYSDPKRVKLARVFDVRDLPVLVIIGPNGEIMLSDAVRLIEKHGQFAFPFTPECLDALAEVDNNRKGSESLWYLLATGKPDHLVKNDGTKVQIEDLIGKTVLLYFATWIEPCIDFLEELIKTYNVIKKQKKGFEIVYICNDYEWNAYSQFFCLIPWLALPKYDSRRGFLLRKFNIEGIPSRLVAFGTNGKLLTEDALDLVALHGPHAFPFTEQCVEELQRGWLQTLTHWHFGAKEFVLTGPEGTYDCRFCYGRGCGWSYRCENDHSFALHVTVQRSA